MKADTEKVDFREHRHVHFREHSRGSVRGSNFAFLLCASHTSEDQKLTMNKLGVY